MNLKRVLILCCTVLLAASLFGCSENTNTSESITDSEKTDTFERVNINDSWFEVLKLPNDVYGIYESGHYQQVFSFLILGSEKSIIFDTGMGISDISQVVKELTDTDIVVVNSHSHFDHIGNNDKFSTIYIYDDDDAVNTLINGISNEELKHEMTPEMFIKSYPEGFNPEEYAINPINEANIHRLKDGDIIDLGNRKLEVLFTPGHSNDGIVLLDRNNRSLFTGDTYYPAELYVLGDIQEYWESMKKLTLLESELDYLYTSHVEPIDDPKVLKTVEQALESIIKGEVKYTTEDYMGYGEYKIYNIEDLQIIMFE